MIPGFTLIEDGNSGAAQTSYVTGSIAPAADRVLYLAVYAVTPSNPASVQPTVTGGGVSTWTEISGSTVTHETRRITWYRALTGATPTSGEVTLDFGAVAQSVCKWLIVEATNTLLTGTNGADSIAQADPYESGASASILCTFGSAWGHPDNRALAVTSRNANNLTFTPGTGFTLIPSATGTNGSLALFYGRDSDTLDVDGTWPSSGRVMASAIEVVGAADVTPPPAFTYPRVRRFGTNGRLN